MRDVCKWIIDSDLPSGGFWFPACWSRALNGDDGECHCHDRPETMQEQIDTLRAEVERLKARA